eukprot:11137759-Heterocapsa_arctica.AAC.1
MAVSGIAELQLRSTGNQERASALSARGPGCTATVGRCPTGPGPGAPRAFAPFGSLATAGCHSGIGAHGH